VGFILQLNPALYIAEERYLQAEFIHIQTPNNISRTKAKNGSPSLQPSLRCHTLLFLPPRRFVDDYSVY